MARALAKGADPNLSVWCAVPWADHCESYHAAGVLFVRYEDLLDDAVRESGRILDYLQIQRNPDEVRHAVEAQSFSKKRAEFKAKRQFMKMRFMRKGRSKQWRERLAGEQKQFFEKEFGVEFRRYGYDE